MIRRLAAPIVIAGVAIVLLATAIPGTFIIDESSYIATIAGLRDGTLRVSATDGLPASPELLAFDSAPTARLVGTMPVAPNMPPLYAVAALPFSFLGLRGLIALQVLAFGVCAWLVFGFVRRETARTDLAWFSLVAFMLCTFTIEYAQGIWPHTLTMALVMGAVDITARLRREGSTRRAFVLAAIAGLCVGFATGVRYQNLAIVGALGIALLWAPRRKLVLAGYVLGCAIPLATSSAMNASRLGSWNPVTKGMPVYLAVARDRPTVGIVQDATRSTYARVVDYTAWPRALPGSATDLILPKSMSGAFLILTGIKKALLQSAPWLILPLIALGASWRRRKAESQVLLRQLSIVVAGVIGMLAAFGFRHDGWSFNQRYLLELVPILCVAFAFVLVGWKPRWRLLAAGGVIGIVIAGVVVRGGDTLDAQYAMMKLPVFFAAVLGVTWLVRERWPKCALVATVTLGIGLGWAATVHITDDIPTSRLLRARNAWRLEAFERAVPDDGKPIAMFAYWGAKDAYGPLLLERDIVLVDPWIDGGKDASTLLDLLVREGRIVYIDRNMPPELFARLARGRALQGSRVPWLIRIAPRASSSQNDVH